METEFMEERLGPEQRPAGTLLRLAKQHDRAARATEAVASYEETICLAEQGGERAVLVEALRRLGVLQQQRGNPGPARELCRKSQAFALAFGDPGLAGEALNALAGFDAEEGNLASARGSYAAALQLAGTGAALRGRIEQSLGDLAQQECDYAGAFEHYERSLVAFAQDGDERECAMACYNLGMMATRSGELEEAERSFARSAAIATRIGDMHLQGSCELNRGTVAHARREFGEAIRRAEAALVTFDQLDARPEKSGAYKLIGMVFRDTGRPVLAEDRLRGAMAVAADAGCTVGQAEAARELAWLYQGTGRNAEALSLLNDAYGHYSRLEPNGDLAGIEAAILAVARQWGQSIESADHYTSGHCDRVAGYAVAMARILGFDSAQQTTLRLGAYLHDVGKLRIPHEISNKPGRLSGEEFDLMRSHTVYGVELLHGVALPWDAKPIIRWHHEKLDGTGYPDRLRGEEIPLSAQVIGIADVFDALTSIRSYRAAMSHEAALAELERCRNAWLPEVYEAFLRCIGAPVSREEVSAIAA